MPTRLLATMITTTTYGSWLPGDLRGYVDHGRILPANPDRLEHARSVMKGKSVTLTASDQRTAFDALHNACIEFNYDLIAVAIEPWHAHILVHHRDDPVATAAARLKARIRQAINRGRIWTAGYDKRYCFTEAEVTARHQYIARHPGHRPIKNNPPH
ncbi:MAG: hypothetical protein AAF078_11740 [Planctomycetota bacterium]